MKSGSSTFPVEFGIKNGERNDRPHPSPLPPERENRFSVFLHGDRARSSNASGSRCLGGGDCKQDERLCQQRALVLPLLGGEGWGEGERVFWSPLAAPSAEHALLSTGHIEEPEEPTFAGQCFRSAAQPR